jgi:glycolate oxidase iron-sulfur subunit
VISPAPPAGPLPHGAVIAPERLASGLPAKAQAILFAEYDNMLSCIRCGQCLTSCPTYVLSKHEAEGPRGRIAMARALVEGHLALTEDLIKHEDNCLVCDACTAVCPAGVHMDPIQVALRAAIEPKRKRPIWQRALHRVVFRHLFANMHTFRLLARLLWLYQASGLQWFARHSGVLRVLGLRRTESFLPPIDAHFLVPAGEVYPASETAPIVTSATSATLVTPAVPVSFFAGCIMSTALAEIDRTTIRVLQRAGCDVRNVAAQGCCGALNAHGGDLPTALELAKRTIAAFEADGHDGTTPIIVNAAGCGAMLKDYAHHLRADPSWADRAATFSARVRDVTDFLASRPQLATPPGGTAPNAGTADSTAASRPFRVTYQEPCHLAHAQRIRQQPRTLLTRLLGATLVEMDESALCCGSAGIYNVTNPNESRRLQQRKLDNALATGADVIATANPGCLLHLQAGLRERGSRMEVKHIVQLLDEQGGV